VSGEVQAVLDELRAHGLLRALRTIDEISATHVVVDGRRALLLCSNDYLGLAHDPRLADAAARGARAWGAGSGSSRLVAGSLALHGELEAELAALKGAEACVLFGSGFLANTGVIPALARAGEVVLSDALNHASLIDGCRLAGAETVVYPHADVDALAAALRRLPTGRPATIVTDSVFSMDGDVAPLVEIVELAHAFGARVIVDEAHATGVVGRGGHGLVAELGLAGQVDVVIGTLSKALGSYGAFACCSAATRELLINRARTLIFSTALPPPSVAAALEAVRILRTEPERVQRLQDNARTLRSALHEQGLQVGKSDIPIVPVLIGDPATAMAATASALEAGVFAQAIRPPTVPDGTSRLRLVATAAHTEKQLRDAAAILAAAVERS
jgi:8-amino-7-oxononanoate synthase